MDTLENYLSPESSALESASSSPTSLSNSLTHQLDTRVGTSETAYAPALPLNFNSDVSSEIEEAWPGDRSNHLLSLAQTPTQTLDETMATSLLVGTLDPDPLTSVSPLTLHHTKQRGDVFIASGDIGDSVSLQFEWVDREALFNNEVGLYVVDEFGRVNGVAPGDPNYAQTALTNSTRQVIFASGSGTGAQQELLVQQGNRLAFYLIQNNTTEAWLRTNPTNQIGKGPLAFFSIDGVNPDAFDHVQSQFLEDGTWQVAWEDLTYGGDRDFDDLVFRYEFCTPIGTDPAAMPTLSITDVALIEGDQETTDAVFTVNLSAASDRPVTVNFAATDDTATADSDYLPVSGTLTFDAGMVTQTITVTVKGDAQDEADERFIITLSDATNATLADAQGQGTILNDDQPSPVLPTVSIDDVTVTEADTEVTEATFTVSLSQASDQPVTVEFATADDSAIADEDYELVNGTLTFAPGETTQTITVPVIGDVFYEGTEQFTVNLSNAIGAEIVDHQGVGTIEETDSLPTITVDNVAVVEGDSDITTATFTVSLSAPIQQPVTVDFATADETAIADQDYQPISGTLTFNPGESLAQTIEVPIVGDTLEELDETFTIHLSNPTNATLSNDLGMGTILNDDQETPPIPPPTITATLANDTGTDSTDGLTIDPTIAGQITSEGVITSLQGRLGDNAFIDLSDALNTDGTFTLSLEQYERLTAGSMLEGSYTVELKGIDDRGQESEVAIVSFILDRTPPDLAFGLAPESDTGVIGDGITTERVVTLVGQTNPGLTVVLVETQQTVTADSEGVFAFTDVAMPIAGQTPFTMVTVDEAGNQGRAQNFLTRIGINGAPTITSTPEPTFDSAQQSSYTYQITATDPDGDPLTYTLLTPLPGAAIDAQGLLSFTPSGNVQPTNDISIEVSDGRGGTDTQTFTVTLPTVNDAKGEIRGIKWNDINANGIRDEVSQVVELINNSSLGYYNANLGDLYPGNPFDPLATYFLGPNISTGDPSTSFINPPDLNTVNNLGNWLTTPADAVTNGFWTRQSIPTIWNINSETAIIYEIDGGSTGISNVTGRFGVDNGAFVWVNGKYKFGAIAPGGASLDEYQVDLGNLRPGKNYIQILRADHGGETGYDISIVGNKTVFSEPGLSNVTVYLDLNNNGVLDPDEPSQLTSNDTSLTTSTPLNVKGTDAIFLAGRTDVTIPSLGSSNLSFPLARHNYIQPDFLQETSPHALETKAGDIFTFAASGTIDFFNGSNGGFSPDGVSRSTLTSLAGISSYNGPVGSLVGVFLNDTNPVNSLTPTALDFSSSGIGTAFTQLMPQLGQVFFIGDGLTGTGQGNVQQFIAPSDATRLFVGLADGFSFAGQPGAYEDNDGSYEVTVQRERVIFGGDYRFTNLSPGAYIVREVVPEGFQQTFPNDVSGFDFHTIVLEEEAVIEDVNFGNHSSSNAAPLFDRPSTIDYIPLTFEYNFNLQSITPQYPSGSDIILGGIPFNIPRGEENNVWHSVAETGNNPRVLDVEVDLSSVDRIHTLLNSYWGQPGPGSYASIEFFGSDDAYFKEDLIGNDDIRDYNNFIYTNNINGITSEEVLVVPVRRSIIHRLDKQVIDLPDSFDDEKLALIRLTDNGGDDFQRVFLSGITADLPGSSVVQQVATGSPFEYQFQASDPNNDPITYSLISGAEGATIDPQTGVFNWTPNGSQLGEQEFRILASDGDLTDELVFSLYVIDEDLSPSVFLPNNAPRVVSSPIDTAFTGVTYQYAVTAIDSNGDELTYTLRNAPDGMEIDSSGVITWDPVTVGSYSVEIEVSDGKDGIAIQSYTLNVTNHLTDTEAPKIQLSSGSTVFRRGDTSDLQIIATDNVGLTNVNLSFNGIPITLNQNVAGNRFIDTASISVNQTGVFEVLVTATDIAGNIGTKTIKIRAIDPTDTEAPIVEIDTTQLTPVITNLTNLIGTVNDDLEFYRVDLAPISLIDLNNPAQADPDYMTIATGTGNVDNGVLAQIDPNLYRNDSYYVRVYAQDYSGNINVQGVVLDINSQNKPGEFSLDFTDLAIPLAGIPIEVNRTYSSLDANFQGDFGYGWSLGLQDAGIVESSPAGIDLSIDDFFGGNSFTAGTRVTLNTPDGRRVGFTFDPTPRGGFLGTSWLPRFTPDPGVYDKLEVEQTPLTQYADGSFGLYLFGFTYNPNQYKLTTKDGTVYNYDQRTGLQNVVDRNGNTLVFTDDGITSSTGAEIDFVRDGEGRITEIIDPVGASIRYTYDANGDLAGVTDRTNNTTTFEYESDRAHYLTEVIDPLGRLGVRTEYDEKGQISRIFDADGNALDINYDSATARQTIRDPFGNTTTYVFDDRGNVVTEIDALGGVTARIYDARNNLLSETNPEDSTTTYTYDDRGNVLTKTDPLGNTTRTTYNATNQVLTETDPLGNSTTNVYDDRGNLIQRSDAAKHLTTYAYDALGLLTAITDPLGNESRFDYDRFGNVTRIVDPTGAEYGFTYDANGNPISLTDPLGNVSRITYNAEGQITAQTDAEGNTSRTEYNAAGDVVAEIDALGRRTEYRYNDRGLLVETIYPDTTPGNLSDNPRTTNEYDALDRLIATTDEAGRKTHYVYDALGRQIETLFPDATPGDLSDNPRIQTEYNGAGMVIAEIDELGNRTEFAYDAAGNLVLNRDALGNETRFRYDAAGQQVAVIDALARQTNFVYNMMGQQTEVRYVDGTRSVTTYDASGNIIAETDQAGNTTQFEYDALGRLAAVVDALGQRTEYGRDAVGNIITQTDANGHTTQFTYDSLGRRTTMILPLGQQSFTTYDAVGNVLSETDFNGETITYSYDARDWLITTNLPDGEIEQFTYTPTGELATVTDERGLTTYSYDLRDRLLSRTEPDGRRISYTYDDAGNVLTLIVPSGITIYTYDALNRLDTVTDPDGGITNYTYDAVGNLIQTDFANGVSEIQEYDSLNRLIYLENLNQSNILSSYRYILDAVGNRIQVEEQDGRVVEYIYDDLYRLTEERVTDPVAGNKVVEYRLDLVGNRLVKIDSVEGTTTYSYDDNDRLFEEVFGGQVTQYQYDNNGNLTVKVENGEAQTQYEWNAKDELVAVETTENGETGRVEFEYNYEGIRIAVNISGEEIRFLIDSNQQEYAQVIEEYQPGTIQEISYVHGLDLISQANADGKVFYQVDGLGSTRQLTNADGLVVQEYGYDAYGNLIRRVGNENNKYLFAGEQFDEVVDGYYLRARYYNPSMGLFVSRDPFNGYLTKPITLPDYFYGNVNPVVYVDPSGNVAFIEYGGKAIGKGKSQQSSAAVIGFFQGLTIPALYFVANYLEKVGTSDIEDEWSMALKETEEDTKGLITNLERGRAIRSKGGQVASDFIGAYLSGIRYEVKLSTPWWLESAAYAFGSGEYLPKLNLSIGGFKNGTKLAIHYLNSLSP